MAYENGTFSSATDLRNKIIAFSVASGWQNPAGQILRRTDGLYYDFGTTIASDANIGTAGAQKIKINAGTGISGSALTGALITANFCSLRGLTTGNYWLFDMGKILHAVVEYETGKYQFCHLGKITDYEGITPNDFVCTSWNYTVSSELDSRYAPLSLIGKGVSYTSGNTTDQNAYIRGVNLRASQTNFHKPNGSEHNSFAMGASTDSGSPTTYGSERSPTMGLFPCSSRENIGLPILLPIYYGLPTGLSSGVVTNIRGDFDGVRQFDGKYLTEKEILFYGTEEWQIFPVYYKGFICNLLVFGFFAFRKA